MTNILSHLSPEKEFRTKFFLFSKIPRMDAKTLLHTQYRVVIHFYIWVKQLNINKITYQKSIDVKYIQLLRAGLNVSWKQQMPIKKEYGN